MRFFFTIRLSQIDVHHKQCFHCMIFYKKASERSIWKHQKEWISSKQVLGLLPWLEKFQSIAHVRWNHSHFIWSKSSTHQLVWYVLFVHLALKTQVLKPAVWPCPFQKANLGLEHWKLSCKRLHGQIKTSGDSEMPLLTRLSLQYLYWLIRLIVFCPERCLRSN